MNETSGNSTGNAVSVEQLAEEYLERLRRGESPTIGEYAAAHPKLADEIRDVFPTLAMLEDVAPDDAELLPDPSIVAAQELPSELGDYRILRELGRGGMGVVYEAEHVAMKRHVALKVLHRNESRHGRDLERFLREARAAGRLHHTNIVPVFEVGSDRGIHFYSMQCIRGQNLDLVLADLKRMKAGKDPAEAIGGSIPTVSAANGLLTGRFAKHDLLDELDSESDELSPSAMQSLRQLIDAKPSADQPVEPSTNRNGDPESDRPTPDSSDLSSVGDAKQGYFHRVANIGTQVADALSYAHDNGVLHRDIKPANLILDTAGTIWVTDFGLARTDGDDLTQTGDIVGTLRYMAPERFKGQADARSDIYSLGLTLYELCTLSLAFDSVDRVELVNRVAQQQPTRPRRINASIPRDLETIILKSIERDPNRRYESAKSMTDDLRRFLADRPIQSRRVSAPEQVWRWCRRNPAVATMVSCIAALVCVVFAGSIAFALSTQRHNEALNVANADSQRSLYEANVSHAHASRFTGHQGQRFETLEALVRARDILFKLDLTPEQRDAEILKLRNAAIAALPLVDLRPEFEWATADLGRMTLSKNGQLVASVVDGGIFRITDLATGRVVAELEGPKYHAWLTMFDDSGKYFAAKVHRPEPETPPQILLWEVESGQVLVHITEIVDTNPTFALGPAGAPLAIARSSGAIEFYSLETGELVAERQFRQSARLVEYDREGHLCVAIDRDVLRMRYDSDEIETISFPARVHEIECGREGDLVVGCDDTNIYGYDARSKSTRLIFDGHMANGIQLCLTDDGSLLGSNSWDGQRLILDMDTGEKRLQIERTNFAMGGFSRDGKRIAFMDPGQVDGVYEVAGGASFYEVRAGEVINGSFDVHPKYPALVAIRTEDGVEVWDILRRSRLGQIEGHNPTSVIFSPDGRSMFFSFAAMPVERCALSVSTDPADGHVRSVTISERQPVTSAGDQRPRSRGQDLQIDSSGRRLIVLGDISTVHIVDLEGVEPVVTMTPHYGVTRTSISPDGQWLASGTWKGDGIKLWDASTGELVRNLKIESRGAHCVFSPDGNWLLACDQRNIFRWDTRHWHEHAIEPRSEFGASTRPAFSPDGSLALVYHAVGAPRLIDPESGQTLAVLQAPVRSGDEGRFSCDGRYLIINARSALHVWDLQRMRAELKTLDLDWN